MKHCLLTILILQLFLFPCKGNNSYPLLPYPQKITFTGKQLVLDQIYLETTGNSISQEWEDWLQSIKVVSTSVQTGKIIKISILDNLPEIPINSNEGYKLEISERQIHVTTTSSTGVYRALQTIQQLTCKSNGYHFLPTCEVIDWPAFRIRGFMHDVGRTYISMAELKKEGNVKALLVTGCMAERYKQEILDEIPEVDAIVGTSSYLSLIHI